MYIPDPTSMGRSTKMTEEELMQSANLNGLGLRLGIAFAAFALLILSLNMAYGARQEQPQTVAADHVPRITGEEANRSY
jgi:hypothetical protein